MDPALGLLGVLLEPTTVIAKALEQVVLIGRRSFWELKTLLVAGAGPIGLLAVLAVKMFGLEVQVLDRAESSAKPDLVRALGATYHSGPVSKIGFQPDAIIESTGAAPAHLSLDRSGRFLLVANYNGGSCAVFPIGRDGRLAPRSAFVQHAGSGPNPERQAGRRALRQLGDRQQVRRLDPRPHRGPAADQRAPAVRAERRWGATQRVQPRRRGAGGSVEPRLQRRGPRRQPAGVHRIPGRQLLRRRLQRQERFVHPGERPAGRLQHEEFPERRFPERRLPRREREVRQP